MLKWNRLLAPLAALIAFALSVAFVLPPEESQTSARGPGLTLDESFNVQEGVYFTGAIAQHGPLLFLPARARDVFSEKQHLPDHPPLGRIWLGLGHSVLSLAFPHSWVGDYNLAGARAASSLAFALTVLLLTHFAQRRFGPRTACFAAAFYMAMPRVVGHSRIASLETVTTLAWLACCVALLNWWTKHEAPSMRRSAISGVLWGLLLLTKVQAVLLPPAIIIWAVARFRQRAVLPLLVAALTGTLVFLAGWPWLWQDPLAHVMEYLGRTSNRVTLKTFFLGEVFPDTHVPFCYPLVMLAAVTPLSVFLMAITTSIRNLRDRAARDPMLALAGLLVLVPLAVFSIPRVPIYDGVRLFLIVFPLVALLAAVGTDRLLEHITKTRTMSSAANTTRRSRVLLPAVAGFVLIWLDIASMLPRLGPLALCEYGNLTLGPRGAHAIGLESEYWGDALITPIWKAVPEDSEVFVSPVLHNTQLLAQSALVPIVQQRKLRLTAYLNEPDRQRGLLLLFRRDADLKWWLREVPTGAKVIYEVRQEGVVLARLLDTTDAEFPVGSGP